MAENLKDNKNLVIIILVLALVVVGGYLYKQNNDTKTVTLNIGDKGFSATVDE